MWKTQKEEMLKTLGAIDYSWFPSQYQPQNSPVNSKAKYCTFPLAQGYA